MAYLKRALRTVFDALEMALSRIFEPAWNPLLNLGALGFFLYWIITASGIYVFIFFDTGITQAYSSIEYMTHDQWYAAGVMRSLHRYASDGLVVVMLLHAAREFSLDRMRGVRWFSWVTGLPVIGMVFVAGISGYWLVWDRLAQYVAIVSTEWLDRLPIFGQPIARNFLSPDTLESRFFTLMIFMHIAVPLMALLALWLHLQRVAKPAINPPLGLVVGTGLSLLALSVIYPATSQGPADLASIPGTVGLDWFYLGAYPALEALPGPVTWGAAVAIFVILGAIPWLPPLKRQPAAVVDLDNCNGCGRCEVDCPYGAIVMQPRTDGKPFAGEAKVDASLCVACGICAGACPTSIPFRRMTELIPGIDLPGRPLAEIRSDLELEASRLSGPGRIMVMHCVNGTAAPHRSTRTAAVAVNCTGHIPPSFIDYVLTRNLADGVMIAGCAANACYNRKGMTWLGLRLAGKRDPQLRARVPRERIRTVWAGRLGARALAREIENFSAELAKMGPYRTHRPASPERAMSEA